MTNFVRLLAAVVWVATVALLVGGLVQNGP